MKIIKPHYSISRHMSASKELVHICNRSDTIWLKIERVPSETPSLNKIYIKMDYRVIDSCR